MTVTATTPSHTVNTGSVGGTPINVDLKGGNVGGDPWLPKRVTLSQNYTAVNPPGFPDRPPAGTPTATVWKPGVVASGTQRYFHAHEAAALVAAGAATYS
jgi:hypothetical protein